MQHFPPSLLLPSYKQKIQRLLPGTWHISTTMDKAHEGLSCSGVLCHLLRGALTHNASADLLDTLAVKCKIYLPVNSYTM